LTVTFDWIMGREFFHSLIGGRDINYFLRFYC